MNKFKKNPRRLLVNDAQHCFSWSRFLIKFQLESKSELEFRVAMWPLSTTESKYDGIQSTLGLACGYPSLP